MNSDRRLSIAGLLGLVAVAAFWLASVRSASVVWTAMTATMTLAALLTGVVGAVVTRGRTRAFWLGFALFGWAYLLLVDWDWVGGPFGHDLTAGLSDWAEQVIPEVPALPAPLGRLSLSPGLSPTANTAYLEAVQQRSIKLGNFVQIGRMTLSLIFGLVGGLVGRTLAGRDEPPR